MNTTLDEGDRLILAIEDDKGVRHELRGDPFVHAAISDVLERTKMMQALIVDLVKRGSIKDKDLRVRAAVFADDSIGKHIH